MKFSYLIVTMVMTYMALNTSNAVAQERLLTRPQQRAYYACLYAAWIDDYCRFHSWSIFVGYEGAFRACILANEGGKFPIEGRGFVSAENYCWSAVQGERRYYNSGRSTSW